VEETLYFAAMLRLPRGMSRAQKAARVADVIQSLGLGRCKDTIIGARRRRARSACGAGALAVQARRARTVGAGAGGAVQRLRAGLLAAQQRWW